MKRMLAIIIVLIVLTFLVVMPSFAAGAYSYEAEAQVLNDLGLYKGISTTEFVPDLGTALNRETGVVMLLRIFGLEEEALAVTDADSVLAKFSDASSISDWAKKSVAYAVENGLVLGYPDGTFGPKAALNGKAYCTLILRQLGYTPDYNDAPAELSDKGGLTELEAVKFTSKDLVNDDLVGISYGSLKAEYSDGATVIEKLISENPDLGETAIAAGIIEEVEIVSLASIPAVNVNVGGTPALPKTVTATYSDKTTADVAVTWVAVDTTKPGTVTVVGTVEGTNIKASCTVNVTAGKYIVSVGSFGPICVESGTNLVLFPNTTATYSDGTTATVNITWESFSTELGTRTVKGSIEGYPPGISVQVTFTARTEQPQQPEQPEEQLEQHPD